MAIFLFHGEDTWSQKEKLKFWRAEFEKKHGGDINISILDGKKISAQEIFQTCLSMPFLGEKRLVIVTDFLNKADEQEKAKMAELIEKIPDFCVLVFSETEEIDRRISLFKRMQKFGKVMEFSPFSGSKLLSWIEKTAERLGGKIEKEAVIYLAEFAAGDLYRLENEIAKLVGYAGDRPITKSDIDLLVNTQLSTSIFKLTDGIGQKNKKLSLNTLHQLIETGEELHMILHMIMRQFRIITSVKDLADQGLSRYAITERLHEHPFVISNTMSQARNFSLGQLKLAYELLIDMDTRLKSGGIKVLAGDNREFVLALDRLVLDLCK
ncbi:DNA polymerase III subunit delta [Candidatus Peregrinibacteria bacterium]|nr:DNA polymerase III subunit delta [Candidatus Peregrinibacteria bacterium]